MKSVTVAGIGVGCGALLAWLFWSLTGLAVVAVVMGAAVAAILVVLAVAGTRYNETYRPSDEARVKRERVRKAIEDTQRHR
jgi:hypothetical protein